MDSKGTRRPSVQRSGWEEIPWLHPGSALASQSGGLLGAEARGILKINFKKKNARACFEAGSSRGARSQGLLGAGMRAGARVRHEDADSQPLPPALDPQWAGLTAPPCWRPALEAHLGLVLRSRAGRLQGVPRMLWTHASFRRAKGGQGDHHGRVGGALARGGTGRALSAPQDQVARVEVKDRPGVPW